MASEPTSIKRSSDAETESPTTTFEGQRSANGLPAPTTEPASVITIATSASRGLTFVSANLVCAASCWVLPIHSPFAPFQNRTQPTQMPAD